MSQSLIIGSAFDEQGQHIVMRGRAQEDEQEVKNALSILIQAAISDRVKQVWFVPRDNGVNVGISFVGGTTVNPTLVRIRPLTMENAPMLVPSLQDMVNGRRFMIDKHGIIGPCEHGIADLVSHRQETVVMKVWISKEERRLPILLQFN